MPFKAMVKGPYLEQTPPVNSLIGEISSSRVSPMKITVRCMPSGLTHLASREVFFNFSKTSLNTCLI
jgi:hypothetical protein